MSNEKYATSIPVVTISPCYGIDYRKPETAIKALLEGKSFFLQDFRKPFHTIGYLIKLTDYPQAVIFNIQFCNRNKSIRYQYVGALAK